MCKLCDPKKEMKCTLCGEMFCSEHIQKCGYCEDEHYCDTCFEKEHETNCPKCDAVWCTGYSWKECSKCGAEGCDDDEWAACVECDAKDLCEDCVLVEGGRRYCSAECVGARAERNRDERKKAKSFKGSN